MFVPQSCPYCRAKNIRKYGFRKTLLRSKVQRYKCKFCLRTFTEDNGFKWKHKSEDTILSCIDLYSKGLTIRETADFLEISKNTVLVWISGYAMKLSKYLLKLPKLSPRLHLDELFLKMKNTFFYVWDSICSESRFIVMFLSGTRKKLDAKLLLDLSPATLNITTDGAFAYLRPIQSKYWRDWTKDHYQRCKDFEDKKNNNLIERFQNTLRRWLHPKRGFKSLRTGNLMLNFFSIFYNFVRIHTALKCSPAEKAGLISFPASAKRNKQRWKLIIESIFVVLIFSNRKLGQSQFFFFLALNSIFDSSSIYR